MNGEEIDIRDLEIGRVNGEGIVRVDIRLNRGGEDQPTVDHGMVDHPWRFAVSATLWRRRNSPDCDAAGQIRETVVRVGTPEARELCRLWKRWHLNDMQGACAHMATPKAYDPNAPVVCPETGYVYGSRWLTEVIPDEEIAAIRAVVASLTEKENNA